MESANFRNRDFHDCLFWLNVFKMLACSWQILKVWAICSETEFLGAELFPFNAHAYFHHKKQSCGCLLRLIMAIVMSTHKLYFYGEISKFIPELSSNDRFGANTIRLKQM